MTVRILHTADWQLGKAFGQIPGDAGVLLRRQRLQTVARIAALARERAVDAVLVAGDVFETDAVSDDTLGRMVEAMRDYHGPWVLLPGNHDPALAEGVWQRLQRRRLPDNIPPALGARPLLLADGRLAILPAPLTRRHEVRDLTEAFDHMETPPGRFGSAWPTARCKTACRKPPRPTTPFPTAAPSWPGSIIWHWATGTAPSR